VVPSIDANAIYTGAIESLGFLDMPEDAWVCVCVCVFISFYFIFCLSLVFDIPIPITTNCVSGGSDQGKCCVK